MTTIALIIISICSNLATGGIVWTFTIRSKQKKERAEAEGKELDNVEKAIKIWRTLSEDQRQQIQGQQDEIKILRSELNELKSLVCTIDCDHRKSV